MACLLGWGITARAAEQKASSNETRPVERQYVLSLRDVTALALRNNFDIQLAKYELMMRRTDHQRARSIYDAIVTAEVKYEDNQRKQPTTIFGTKVVDNEYNFGVSKKLASGTTIAVDMANHRSATNSVFSTAPLIHDSTLGITVTQDLGRNFFGRQDRDGIRLRDLEVQRVAEDVWDRVEAAVARVQKAYWGLVLQQEKEQIQKDMVEQARRLYRFHQDRLADGLVELPEVLASEANYKKRQNALTLAENQTRRKANELKLLLNISPGAVVILPAEDLDIGQPRKISFPEVLKQALVSRRDYRQAKTEVQKSRVQLSLRKGSLWPEINLKATFEKNGLGDHFKQAVTQITEEDNPRLLAGLSVRFPLGDRKARSDVREAKLSRARALVRLKQVEQQIAMSVMDQVRDCRVFYQVAVASEEVAHLQARKLEEEEKRFQQGRSDTDTLVRFQEDVVRARGEAAEAKYRYHLAVVDLQRKSGRLLWAYRDDLL